MEEQEVDLSNYTKVLDTSIYDTIIRNKTQEGIRFNECSSSLTDLCLGATVVKRLKQLLRSSGTGIFLVTQEEYLGNAVFDTDPFSYTISYKFPIPNGYKVIYLNKCKIMPINILGYNPNVDLFVLKDGKLFMHVDTKFLVNYMINQILVHILNEKANLIELEEALKETTPTVPNGTDSFNQMIKRDKEEHLFDYHKL